MHDYIFHSSTPIYTFDDHVLATNIEVGHFHITHAELGIDDDFNYSEYILCIHFLCGI